MNIDILTPQGKFFSGNAFGIQLPGIDGLFEILDHHASLISALGKGNLKILKGKNSFENYTIEGGFVEVLNNQVTVLAESVKPL